MTEIITGSIYNEIRDKFTKEIDLKKLPLFGEKEIFKVSAESYGLVKIKLTIEDDHETIDQIRSYGIHKNEIRVCYFTYKWEANENALPRDFEQFIKPEIVSFINLLSIFRERDQQILRFTIVDGGFKATERPGHKIAVQYALIDLFKQI